MPSDLSQQHEKHIENLTTKRTKAVYSCTMTLKTSEIVSGVQASKHLVRFAQPQDIADRTITVLRSASNTVAYSVASAKNSHVLRRLTLSNFAVQHIRHIMSDGHPFDRIMIFLGVAVAITFGVYAPLSYKLTATGNQTTM